ncbi:MAG: adenylate cyclase [Bacteroidetes bacterium]|jgi:CYTH domain-containing protein|nr:adenylate cyclase [Bacteroidota bacterium]
MGREVERKFLVNEVPEAVRGWPATIIQQGYLAIQEDGTEVRVRKRGAACVLTVKRGAGLEREEVEVGLAPEAFAALWPLTSGRRVHKTRYVGRWSGHRVEVDVYRGAHAGLEMAEVEFPHAEASRAFTPPSWFGRDVTEDRRFANQQLACQGLPEVPASR